VDGAIDSVGDTRSTAFAAAWDWILTEVWWFTGKAEHLSIHLIEVKLIMTCFVEVLCTVSKLIAHLRAFRYSEAWRPFVDVGKRTQ
jgi:hypothetical protein